MKIAVLNETAALERRVPLVPDSVKRLRQKTLDVVVESGAGDRALFAAAEYTKEGATVLESATATIAAADALLRLRVPTLEEGSRTRQPWRTQQHV